MKENISRVADELIDYEINTANNLEAQVKDFLMKFNLVEEVEPKEWK